MWKQFISEDASHSGIDGAGDAVGCDGDGGT